MISNRTCLGVLAMMIVILAITGCRAPKEVSGETPVPAVAVTSPPATNQFELEMVQPRPPAEAADNMASNVLVWDAVFKEQTAVLGQTNAVFLFSLTNIVDRPVTIYATETTCDCTVAKMPAQPWQVSPGAFGEIRADIDLRKKSGASTNYVIVFTSEGNRLLSLKTFTPR